MPAPPSLDATIGGIELGVLFAFLLTGITTVQLFIYYQSAFAKDGRFLKFVVLFVFAFECLHDALIAAYLYHATIRNFGNYANLAVAHWTLAWSVAVSSIASGTVQAFFGWRILRLSEHWWISVLSWMGVVSRIGLSFAVSSLSSGQLLTNFNNKFRWLEGLTLAVGMTNDIVNTSGLSYVLWKSKGEITRSRRLVEKLIVWTIETGFVTTVMSTLSLILLFVSPETPAFLSVSIIFAKLYSNSLLASLNGRAVLRATADQTTLSFMSDRVRPATLAFAPPSTDTGSGTQIFIDMGRSPMPMRAIDSSNTLSRTDTKHGDISPHTQDLERDPAYKAPVASIIRIANQAETAVIQP